MAGANLAPDLGSRQRIFWPGGGCRPLACRAAIAGNAQPRPGGPSQPGAFRLRDERAGEGRVPGNPTGAVEARIESIFAGDERLAGRNARQIFDRSEATSRGERRPDQPIENAMPS